MFCPYYKFLGVRTARYVQNIALIEKLEKINKIYEVESTFAENFGSLLYFLVKGFFMDENLKLK